MQAAGKDLERKELEMTSVATVEGALRDGCEYLLQSRGLRLQIKGANATPSKALNAISRLNKALSPVSSISGRAKCCRHTVHCSPNWGVSLAWWMDTPLRPGAEQILRSEHLGAGDFSVAIDLLRQTFGIGKSPIFRTQPGDDDTFRTSISDPALIYSKWSQGCVLELILPKIYDTST